MAESHGDPVNYEVIDTKVNLSLCKQLMCLLSPRTRSRGWFKMQPDGTSSRGVERKRNDVGIQDIIYARSAFLTYNKRAGIRFAHKLISWIPTSLRCRSTPLDDAPSLAYVPCIHLSKASLE